MTLLVISLGMWWHVWITGSPSSTITCQCGDPAQEVWFLAWVPWAISHGHNLFFSNAIFAGQGGINLLSNTGIQVPALLLSPVTWAFGPIASFNVATLLAPVVSGMAFLAAARKVSTFVPGQVLGTLLYALSPFVVWNGAFGHLNLTLLFFPPLAFVLLYDLVVTKARSPVRNGLLLGILVVVQFFTGTEVLAMTVLAAVVACAVAIALAPRAAWADRRAIAVGFATALLSSAVILAYPLYVLLEGPRHVVGPAWTGSARFGLPVSAIVEAGGNVHGVPYVNQVGGYFGAIGPNFSVFQVPNFDLLGPVLVAVLALTAVVWWRSRLAWVLVAAGMFAWLCSFGTSLGSEVSAHPSHSWWLPWNDLGRLPLIESVFPLRFGVLMDFAAALLLVVALDSVRRDARRIVGRVVTGSDSVVRGRRRLAERGVIIAAVAIAASGMIPIGASYGLPYTMHSTASPPWFRKDAHRVPDTTVVLVLPFLGQSAMGWQAEAGFPFALADGFGIVPGTPTGRVALPGPVASVLGRLSPNEQVGVPGPMPGSQADVDLVRVALVSWGVGAIEIPFSVDNGPYAAGFMTAVTGRPPTIADRSWFWPNLGDGSARLEPGTLSGCALRSERSTSPLEVPDCVLAGSRQRR